MHDWKATIAEAEAKYDDLDESDVFSKNVSLCWTWYVTLIVKKYLVCL